LKKNEMTESFLNKLLLYSLEVSSDCVCWVDEHTEIVYANTTACRKLGYSPDEITGRKIDVILQSAGASQLKKLFGAARKPRHRVESGCVLKNGDIVASEITVIPRKIENHQMACLIIRDISCAARSKAVLERRLELEDVVAGMSSRFIKSAPDEIDGEINRSLEQLGRFGDADRAYIFLIRPDGLFMDNTHEWCAKGIEPQKKNLQNCWLDDFPWWMKRLKRLETITINDVEKLTAAASMEKSVFKSQDIKSLLAAPLVSGAYLHGFIGFDAVREKREWPDGLVKLLKISGEIIITALERKRSGIVIQNKIEDLQKVADMAVKMKLEIFSLKSKLAKFEKK